jgi:hypothetical protein
MYNLTLQIYGGGVWKDAMTLSFDDPSKGFLGSCRFACKAGYVLDAYANSFSQGVSASLADILDPQQAFERLRHDARQLRALPDMLRDSGLPDATFNHPAIALGKLDERLTTWGLQ